LIHSDAPGIDIGSAAHFVALPPDRDDEPVREFESFTADLEQRADWLKACGVETVAMESTAVQMIPLFALLRASGFTALLVGIQLGKVISDVVGRTLFLKSSTSKPISTETIRGEVHRWPC
jgi:transposase